jgi:hypothetical protein
LSAGTVTTGAVRSTTVILKVRVVVCPWALALHVTTVGPSGKIDPEGGLQSTVIGRP